MLHASARQRSTTATLLALLAAAVGVVVTLTLGSGATPAAAQTTPGKINSVVVRLTGEMRIKLDPAFVKTMKRSKAKVVAKSGAKYSGKKRLATMAIDSTTAVIFDPADADIMATGTLQLRRPDRRNVKLEDITLRIRAAGADLGATVRGRPTRQFAALTISPTIAITPTERGASFIDLQMLVSADLAKAARQAKIKGVKEGALLGLLSVDVAADIPSFQLPGITIPGLTPGEIPGF